MATRPPVRVALLLLLVSAAVAVAAGRQLAAQPTGPGPEAAKPAPAAPAKSAAPASQPAKAPEPPFDEQKAMADLRKEIAGREKEAAGKVYMAVEVMQGNTADQLLALMQQVYSRALGVTCTHCHIPGQWQADDKKPKEIARGMIQMMARINNDLPRINSLERPYRPAINCITCHRGQLKPATQLP